MKTRNPNLMSICAVVAVVLSFTGTSKSHLRLVKNESDAFLIRVGTFSILFRENFYMNLYAISLLSKTLDVLFVSNGG